MLVLVSKPLLPHCRPFPEVLLLAWLGWASMVMADVERPVVQHHLHVGCFKDFLLRFFSKKYIYSMSFYEILWYPPWYSMYVCWFQHDWIPLTSLIPVISPKLGSGRSWQAGCAPKIIVSSAARLQSIKCCWSKSCCCQSQWFLPHWVVILRRRDSGRVCWQCFYVVLVVFCL